MADLEPDERRPLQGQTALVSGGAVRLGAIITRALGSAGCRVAVHYHSSHRAAESLVRELAHGGTEARAFAADLSTAEGASDLVAEVHASLGPIQVLVNSAARFEPTRLLEASDELWEAQFNLNLRAPFRLIQEFVQQLPANEGGTVLNILDARLRRPRDEHLVYRLSKAALMHLTLCLATDLAPRVRVNGLAPGAILPPGDESQDQMAARLASEIPLGLPDTTLALRQSVLELLTNPFLTGQIIYLDGGQFL